MSTPADRLKEVPDKVFMAAGPLKDIKPEPGHPLFGFTLEEIDKEAARRAQVRDAQSTEHRKTVVAAQIRQIESKYAHLPPLPSRLPRDTTERATINDSIRRFYEACQQGLLEEVQDYVETEKPGIEYLQYGLGRAAEESRVHVIRFLFSKGCQFTSTVLEEVCIKPSLEIFKLLIEEQGWHPNQSMQSSGVALPPESRDPTTLEAAAEVCTPDIIDLLVEHGANLEYGFPVHCAALAHPKQPGRAAMIRHLIDLGVDIDRTCNDPLNPMVMEGTPLACCVNWGNQEAVELLLELRAHPDGLSIKPSWYLTLVDKVKRAKGEPFWVDVRAAFKPNPPKHSQ
ncbi:hypothetical protein F5B20DRAFT_596389 [Whalleya microplaca]|nr:hypothetical protein F5B20DRAFT_596389 [Whalleya microplaca]